MSTDPSKRPPWDANNSTLLDMVMGPLLTADPPIPGISKLQTMGPVLLPLPANCLLASLLTIQITRYWTSPVRKHDAWPTKGLVWVAMVFALANMICIWAWSFDAFVINLGKPHALFRVIHITPLLTLLHVEAFLMHCWYAYKTYHLYGKSIWPPGVIMILTAASSITAILGVIVLSQERSILASGTTGMAFRTAQIGTSLGAAADISITALVLNKLIRSRRNWKDSDLLAARAGLLIFEAQIIPTILAMTSAIYTQRVKRPDCAIVWASLGGNIYALSVLYSLTSRTWFRRGNYRDGSDKYYGKEVDVKVDTEVVVARCDSDPNPLKARHPGLRPNFSEERLDLDLDWVGDKVESPVSESC